MFASFLVTFRETLEIAIIVSVVLATTKEVGNRNRWIFGGFFAGILGSGIMALFADNITNFFDGMGQEIMNASILLTAAAIIGFTAVWMKSHAKTMVKKIKHKTSLIAAGDLPKFSLSIIIFLAVLREGAEIVLFTFGMIASGTPIATIISGSTFGILSGTAVGMIIYYGIAKIPTSHIFGVTTYLLLLLTAGMAATGVKYLVAAGYFSDFTATVWDLSHLLPESSIFGQILHALFGYSDNPMQIQIIFYIITFGFFFSLIKLGNFRERIR